MPEIPKIDIRPDHWEIVRDILQKHVPQYAVWAFGSRAKWTAKQYSDLDLAIITDEPLPISVSAALADDFSESDLPWKVDVVDWAGTGEPFRQIIERKKVVVQEATRGLNNIAAWRQTMVGDVFQVNPGRPLKRGVTAAFIPMEVLPLHARSVTSIKLREYLGSGMRFQNGDTLIARITPCLENGKTAFVSGLQEGEVAYGSTEYIVLCGKSKETDSLFGYYLTRFPVFRQYAIGHMEGTSGRQRVSSSAIEKFAILLPPLAEQRAIAHILGTLDDKIELNRSMSQTLEEMARTLFKSWFVDFDGVPLEDMQESELGLIPKGWRIGTLSDLIKLNPEVWTKQTRPNEIRYVDLSSTKWGRIESVMQYMAEDAPSRAQRVLRKNDTIVGTVRPGNGSYALINEDGLTGSTGFAVLRPKRNEYTAFVYLAATEPDNIEALANLADGGAYPAVRAEVVAATAIVIADEEAINTFSLCVSPLLEMMAKTEQQSHTLAHLRNTLLPNLISGELRLKDAERIAETA